MQHDARMASPSYLRYTLSSRILAKGTSPDVCLTGMSVRAVRRKASGIKQPVGRSRDGAYRESNSSARFSRARLRYPGWYRGRTVHIHFKIRTGFASTAHEFTSQLYFDDALTDRVHVHLPYARKGQRTMRNADDGISRGGGMNLLLKPVQQEPAYAAGFDVVLQIP